LNSLNKINEVFFGQIPINKKHYWLCQGWGHKPKHSCCALKFVASCALLQIALQFIVSCFGHLMFKTCQYATNETNVWVGMKEVSLMNVRVIYKISSHGWKNIERKGMNGLLTYKETSLKPRKLKALIKTRFASKCIILKNIGICYNHKSLLQSTNFQIANLCTSRFNLGYCKGSD
jgi:hypothetical protein